MKVLLPAFGGTAEYPRKIKSRKKESAVILRSLFRVEISVKQKYDPVLDIIFRRVDSYLFPIFFRFTFNN